MSDSGFADVEKKIIPGFFQMKLEGRKNWELRVEDNHTFAIGEKVKYREWCPVRREYTGRFLVATVDDVIRIRPMISEGSVLMFDHVISHGSYQL